MACPICGKDTAPQYRPFCSKRCADVDLAKWFDGTYTLHSDEETPQHETDDTPKSLLS